MKQTEDQIHPTVTLSLSLAAAVARRPASSSIVLEPIERRTAETRGFDAGVSRMNSGRKHTGWDDDAADGKGSHQPLVS